MELLYTICHTPPIRLERKEKAEYRANARDYIMKKQVTCKNCKAEIYAVMRRRFCSRKCYLEYRKDHPKEYCIPDGPNTMRRLLKNAREIA